MYENVKNARPHQIPHLFAFNLYVNYLRRILMSQNYVMLHSNANNADPDHIPLQSAISESECHYLHFRNALVSSYKQCKM